MPFYRRKKRTRRAPKATCKEEKCITPWCKNKRAIQFTVYKSASGKVIRYQNSLRHCWKCRSRMLKKNRLHTYVLNMLRHSARKRNLPFTLTIAEFKKFCDQTGYLELRGNKPWSLTIDRKDENEGYHIWNIRVLTHEENSEQGANNTPREERIAEAMEAADIPF